MTEQRDGGRLDAEPAGARARHTDAAAERGKLRVALLLDGYTQAAWIARLLADIRTSAVADVVLVVLNGATQQTDGVVPRSIGRRAMSWWRNRDSLPYALYRRWDRARYGSPDDPEHEVDVTDLLGGCPVVTVSPRMTKFSDFFDDAAVSAIRDYDVDVALRFGFRILKGDALRIARYGVWSFHHGDNRVNRGGPPGLWEVMEDAPVTGAILQVLSEELDAGLVLARSFSSTEPVSATANKRTYYWQAAPMLIRTLRALHSRGGAILDEARGEGDQWSAYSSRLYVAPKGLEMVRGWARLAGRLLRRRLSVVGVRWQWFLAYRVVRNPGDRRDVPDGAPHRFRELIPPPDRFWADPIPVAHDGAYLVFFEEYIVGTPHGHICVVEIAQDGTAGTPRRVLERPYHLSYPFVFRWNDTWYMIPETIGRRTVELYRATGFPDEWTFDRTLLQDVAAADATVAEVDGRWWMFTAVAAPNATEPTLLHVYHADSPLGPWEPHAGNPVKFDVRSSRPAGPLFRYRGALYRPAQDGSPVYGSAVTVLRIDVLTPTTFREVEVSRLTPSWRKGLNGTHTLAAAGGLTVIDARQPIRVFR